MIKARLRSLRLDRSRKRMLSAVPRATMVVANPTHYAVAMRYVRAEGGAPIVVAKGADLIALKIRAIAEDARHPGRRGQAARALALRGRRRRPADSGGILSSGRRDRASDPAEEGSMGPTKALNPAGRRSRQRRPFAREQIIADALVDVASELRLTDAAELMLMIRNDHAANIADLVNSSTELFFKSGTLRYALSASFKAPWDATPVVAIDMEFRHAVVCAFFRLTDRPAPGGSRNHRHPVRRAGSGRTGQGRAPLRRARRARGCGPRLSPVAGASSMQGGAAQGRSSLSAQGMPRPIVLDLSLRSRVAEGAMAVGAPDGDRRQRRQRQYAWLSRPRHPAVFRRARLFPDRDGRRPIPRICRRRNRRPAHCARSRPIHRNRRCPATPSISNSR